MFAQTDPNYKTKHKQTYCSIPYFQGQFNSTYIIWWILSHRKCQWGPCQWSIPAQRRQRRQRLLRSLYFPQFKSVRVSCAGCNQHHGWSSWSKSPVSVFFRSARILLNTSYAHGSFLSHRGTPSYHRLFFLWIFHEMNINHPAIGVPPLFLETFISSIAYRPWETTCVDPLGHLRSLQAWHSALLKYLLRMCMARSAYLHTCQGFGEGSAGFSWLQLGQP